MSKAKIKLGPAGSCGQGNLKGVEFVKRQGLQAMEVEFTYGVNMKAPLAKQVGEVARKNGIELSVHAPYWINLNSKEKKKIRESKQRIIDSCERAALMGAKHVVFHPGFYGGAEPEKVYEIIKESIIDIQKVLQQKGWNVILTPETTGKATQFGSFEELLRLRKEAGTSICVDFAHMLARTGDPNAKNDYKSILKKFHGHIHSHFSGMEYTAKGEKRHLNLGKDVKPEFEPLAREILKQGSNITIICESPITWKDSLKMKKIFEKLGYKFV